MEAQTDINAAETENGGRRISKPKRQYSPTLDVSTIRAPKKVHQQHVKEKTEKQHGKFHAEEKALISAYLMQSRESSLASQSNGMSDEEEDGVDTISQRDLRTQLEQMIKRDFKLPRYKDIPVVNGGGPHSNYQNISAYFDEDSTDEQEEIKVVKPLISEDAAGSTYSAARVDDDEEDAEFPYDFWQKEKQPPQKQSPKIQVSSGLIKPRPKLGLIQSKQDGPHDVGTSDGSILSSKRPRRPPKKSDDFVYMSVGKTMQPPPMKPIRKKVPIVAKEKPEERNVSIPIKKEEDQSVEKSMSLIRQALKIRDGVVQSNEVEVVNTETGLAKATQHLPRTGQTQQWTDAKSPTKSIAVELAQSISKRVRRPIRSEEFIYTSLTMPSPTAAENSAPKLAPQPQKQPSTPLHKFSPPEPKTPLSKTTSSVSLNQSAVFVSSTDGTPTIVKRGRGRPRKFPIDASGIQGTSENRKKSEKPASFDRGGISPTKSKQLDTAKQKPGKVLSAGVVALQKAISEKLLEPQSSEKLDGRSVAAKKAARERSERQMQQLKFIKRMTQCRQLNPLAMGLQGQLDPEGDYFYREIFVGIGEPDQSDSAVEEEDLEVDCVGVSAPGGFDELLITNPAENCANSVCTILSKYTGYSPIDPENPDEDFSQQLSLRIGRMDELMQEYLHIFLDHIKAQRLVDSATLGIAGGTSMYSANSMKNAHRLRESLQLYSQSLQALIVAIHKWILRNLDLASLVSYLNLLRFLKSAGSSLSEHIVKHARERDIREANVCISEFISEPPSNPSSKLIDTEPIKNASLVLVYPQIQINGNPRKHFIRAHETLFRNLLPLVVCCVEKVELNFDVVETQLSVQEITWKCIRLIQRRVQEIVRRRPNDHIFLAGWGTSCYLNHKAVSEVSGVSGLLDFAFPTESPCGSRGSIDDRICLTYPSTLFVVGEEAQNVRMKAMMEMRKNMLADTGLVVIGGANHNLLVSPTVLSIERTTQFAVHKSILECAVQFMKQVMSDIGPPRECRHFLKPVKMSDIYEVDPNYLRLKPSGPTKPRKAEPGKKHIGEESKKDRETAAGAMAERAAHVHKTSLRHPTQIASNLPPQLRPTAPTTSGRFGSSASHMARSSFSSSLRTAVAESGDPLKIPSPETLNQQIPSLLSVRGRKGGGHSPPASSSGTFQDTLQEEEEAAAALAFLK